MNEENSAGLTEQTPADFLILCTLHAEKFLAERYLEANPGSKAAGLNMLLVEVGCSILESVYGASETEVESARRRIRCRLKTDTGLFDLPNTREIRFLDLAGAVSVSEMLEGSLVNLALLRNYVAHHTGFDFELVHTQAGVDPFESLLVVVLSALQAYAPPDGPDSGGFGPGAGDACGVE